MNLEEATKRANDVRALYAELEERRFDRNWTTSDIMLGFMGDVGDLAKLIQAHAGVRNAKDLEQDLAHELADCLWAILVLAEQCDVNLEAAFRDTMDDLERRIQAEVSTES